MSFVFFWYAIAPILALAGLGVTWMTGVGALTQDSTLGLVCLSVSVVYAIYVVIAVQRGWMRLRS